MRGIYFTRAVVQDVICPLALHHEVLPIVNFFPLMQICYGMIYGIGAKALGEQLDVSEDDASCFMETFRDKYKGRNVSKTHKWYHQNSPHSSYQVESILIGSHLTLICHKGNNCLRC